MTKEEAIKYLQQIYPNGGYCWLDNQRIEAIGMAIQALQEEPVSEDLEEAAEMFIDSLIPTEVDTVTPFAAEYVIGLLNKAIEFGAKWQKEQFEKNRLKHCNSITNEQAEKFIQEHTRKLTQYGDDYFLWVTPNQARKAVEIAREETTEKLKRLLKENYLVKSTEPLRWVSWDKVFEDLKQAMKDE